MGILAKVGDLVSMQQGEYEWFDGDAWGVGIVVKASAITERQRQYCAVYWSAMEAVTWEMSDALGYVDESR